MRKLISGLLLFLFPLLSSGQRIDNLVSFRNISGEKYIRLHYDNDFWGKSDYYYTQGYNLEFVNPALKNNPLAHNLLKLKNSRVKYGIALEHYGFTPTIIASSSILYKDRPYAGVILLKSFSISVDTIHRSRLSSVLSTGMIGPVAFAGPMQKKIHSWTGDNEPMGWQFQIKNDAAINYEVNYEKELFNVPNIISLNTNSQIRLGTLSDKLQAGATLTLGKFDSPFEAREKLTKQNFQLYLYFQPLINLVGYDATMQGGVFNRDSPYTLKANEINRLVYQNSIGAVLNFRNIYLEFNHVFLSKEFKEGMPHQWGGVRIGLAF
ncbi:lipid A deacylase LpxR family protein [Dyadobacter sp. CY345]|uniref:lipid A deacylase LpxR family protein n=1 Tax=Dyadobacter sp. CY345 TaxID=2909335 RepID=UPI001F3D2E2C|nr:lipid A deacylase LpxR family protein [Dyadobacter sp. CY345]MCF2442328.1 lipid A deacylase LpxR family protein [Dyadobacter sp. CY345]